MNDFMLSAFADEIDPDLKIQMDVLRQHGIDHIEMRGVYGKSIVSYSLEEVKSIKQELDANGFKISALGSPIGKIGILDDFRPHLDLFRHALDIAAILETKYIRMFSFYMPEGESADKYRDEVLERWNSFLEAARDYDIVLLHENEKGIYGDTPERCLDLLESLGSDRTGLTFDPANFVQCNVETYPKAFKMLKNHIRYMHIKDALYANHQVVPAGHGDGRLGEILSGLKDHGFKGFLSIEPHLGDFIGFADLEKEANVEDLPEGGPKQFAIAANAFKKLIEVF
ncbi:MAG TPA: sugar phosphate isomerase/epimerase family protein [Candidatus Atribacteria bacterium]|nr:sugar phosphate isomerase/epimerase family protein [Candidatus Atribacteria bacterium]HPT78232.1 sugar phosphate isomerase/epimerase family protein [Candidatus Atribacteria bacterium]